MQGTPGSSTLGYFKWAFIVTAVGLLLGLVLGWQTTGTWSGTAAACTRFRAAFSWLGCI